MDGEAGEADDGAGGGVGVALEAAKFGKGDAPGGHHDNGHHGCDGYEREYGGDQGHSEEAGFGGRVHQNRNQRLARAENKDGKQNPRGDIGTFFIVDMCVVVCVGMFVFMGSFAAV